MQRQTETSSSHHSDGPNIYGGECVAICTVGELFGGVERHVLGMMSSLQAQSVSTLLVLFHDGELAAQARGQGIDPIVLSSLNRSLLATAQHLARLFKQRNIRVVHVHGYKATVFCSIARLWYRFALVKTEHGLPELMAGSLIRTLRNQLYYFFDRVATRTVHTTVCYVTDDLRTHYRSAHAGLKATVIPNGVANMDQSQFARPSELRHDCFNLVMVGRLERVKGHHLAIEAIAEEIVPQDVHLYLIGSGPCESELRTLVQTRGVADRVHLLGFRRTVYDYIAHGKILLMPSLHEGLPYTLLEAMALGIPIIASRVGGLAEVIHHERTGLLIPPQDSVSLAQAILRLYEESALRFRLGKEARSLQQTSYSLQSMTARYLTIYHELVKNSR